MVELPPIEELRRLVNDREFVAPFIAFHDLPTEPGGLHLTCDQKGELNLGDLGQHLGQFQCVGAVPTF